MRGLLFTLLLLSFCCGGSSPCDNICPGATQFEHTAICGWPRAARACVPGEAGFPQTRCSCGSSSATFWTSTDPVICEESREQWLAWSGGHCGSSP